MTSAYPWTPAKIQKVWLKIYIKQLFKTYPFLQHSDIDDHIEKAFKDDQSFESCGQVKVETKIRFELVFSSGCGGKTVAYLDIPNWVVVKPEHDGDEDDGKDEDDEEADCDGHQQASHHAVGGVDLHIKVDSKKTHRLKLTFGT